ncbi:MAG: Hsp33 family molecular chaperone [Alphaproteobacteria bacterium]|nr:Hsp33 family molecular chaperone [Alphaproteobacteria bacterium]
MTPKDFVRGFQIEGMNVRGRIVHLTELADRVIAAHGYPEPVSRVAGEALVLAALLGSSLKFDGTLTVQTRGQGPLRMVVADYTASGSVRACATFDREAVEALGASPAFEDLVGPGSLAITIDPGGELQRYQGVVPLEGQGLAGGAMAYFERSEQIPTQIKLSVATLSVRGQDEARPHWRAGGMLIQNLASLGGLPVETKADDWTRAAALFSTVEAHELVDPLVEAERLLYRLYHEDGVRVFDVQPLKFECRCSAERVSSVLRQYSADELNDLVEADGLISATCEFCSTRYEFSPADISKPQQA